MYVLKREGRVHTQLCVTLSVSKGTFAQAQAVCTARTTRDINATFLFFLTFADRYFLVLRFNTKSKKSLYITIYPLRARSLIVHTIFFSERNEWADAIAAQRELY